MIKGIQGILTINQDSGEIIFIADPRHTICKNTELLKITGVPPRDIVKNPIEIDMSYNENVTGLSTIEQNTQLAITQPTQIVKSGVYNYTNILYPNEIIDIYEQQLKSPEFGAERQADQLISTWVEENVTNFNDYVRQLILAVQQSHCVDMVFARLIAELTDENKPDIIEIKRNRTRLPHEFDLSTAHLNEFHDANTFYSTQEEIELKRLRLNEKVRNIIKEKLKATGHTIPDQKDAFITLEENYTNRTIEQSILARLTYLALLEKLNGVDCNQLIDRLFKMLPTKQIKALTGPS